jgi:hypothetical protein
MGASSVTGISGPGSAEGLNKGPGNGRNQYVPLVSPHVIAAGTVTLSSNTAVVELPKPAAQPASGYAILVTGSTAAAYITGSSNDATTGGLTNFTIHGGSTDSVSYAIVQAGVQ